MIDFDAKEAWTIRKSYLDHMTPGGDKIFFLRQYVIEKIKEHCKNFYKNDILEIDLRNSVVSEENDDLVKQLDDELKDAGYKTKIIAARDALKSTHPNHNKTRNYFLLIYVGDPDNVPEDLFDDMEFRARLNHAAIKYISASSY